MLQASLEAKGMKFLLARQTEALLEGRALDLATVTQAVASLRSEIDPLPDLTNTPDTKRHLAGVLLHRMLPTVATATATTAATA